MAVAEERLPRQEQHRVQVCVREVDLMLSFHDFHFGVVPGFRQAWFVMYQVYTTQQVVCHLKSFGTHRWEAWLRG